MHIHASALEFLIFAAYAVIFGFLWRSTAAALAKSNNDGAAAVGRGMSFIF